MKKLSFYGIISSISVLIRHILLPNPFECFGFLWGGVLNWIAEPLIYISAFKLVGLFYERGECPALGSFLYLIAYSSMVGLLYLLGVLNFAWWTILIILFFVSLIIKILRWIKEVLV